MSLKVGELSALLSLDSTGFEQGLDNAGGGLGRPRGGDVVFSDSLIDPLRAVVAKVLGAPEGPDPDAPKLHITSDLTGAGLMAEKAVA